MPTDALINVNGESVQALEILLLTTIMMLLPSLIIMMTSFTRYVVVFSFLRSAMGTQQTPPNMVLVGMALILTLFTMSPTLSAINEEAFQPYQEEEITQEEFFDRDGVRRGTSFDRTTLNIPAKARQKNNRRSLRISRRLRRRLGRTPL